MYPAACQECILHLHSGTKRRRTDEKNIGNSSSYLTESCPNLGPPSVMSARGQITIPFEELDLLAIDSYRAITGVLFKYGVPKEVLTEEQYTSVIRTVFKSKLDFVASHYGMEVLPNKIPFLSNTLLPRALADCINAYGLFYCNGDSYELYPAPTIAAEGQYSPSCEDSELTRFHSFIVFAEYQGIIRTSRLKEDVRGTGAWMLRCRPDGPHTDKDLEHVLVRSQFKEYTAEDAIIAALILNKRDCIVISGCNRFFFCSKEISYVSYLRSKVILS